MCLYTPCFCENGSTVCFWWPCPLGDISSLFMIYYIRLRRILATPQQTISLSGAPTAKMHIDLTQESHVFVCKLLTLMLYNANYADKMKMFSKN